MMKKLTALLLLLSLLLCACAQEPEATEPSASLTTTAPATTQAAEDTDPAAAVTTEPSTSDTAPAVVKYRHPLTGQPLEEPFKDRATVLVINNSNYAMPQLGISMSDMVYEFETEGGTTRMLAVFTSLKDAGNIGPIRSARTYFSNIALSYDAPLIHCGTSDYATKGRYEQNGKNQSNWAHIDQMFNTQYFYRDNDRYKQGYAWEHTLFTSGEKLLKGLEAKGYNKTYDTEVSYGLSFADDPGVKGEPASTVRAVFRGGKKTTMTYDSATGLYSASQYGEDQIDGNTGKVLTYRNVLILKASQWGVSTSNHSFYKLVGSGQGYFACGGQIIPIKWNRSSVNAPFAYTDMDGEPLTFGVGRTYVAVTDDDCKPQYE